MKKYKLGVFPGVFDPFTIGHLEVVKKALHDFEKIHIVIMENKNKKPYFSLEKRMKIINVILNEKIKIFYWPNLAIDYCAKNDTNLIIRGYRNSKDLAYEKNLMKKYLTQNNKIKVLLYQTDVKISSSLVKRMILNKKDISNLIPKKE